MGGSFWRLITISYLRSPFRFLGGLFQGADAPRRVRAADRVGELIALTRKSSQFTAGKGPRKHPLNSQTRYVNLSDQSGSNFLLNLPTGKEAHPKPPNPQ